jgi:hypothetical protein
MSLEIPSRQLHIVLMDGDAPWIRALFAAMPEAVSVSAFRPRGPVAALRRPFDLIQGWRRTAHRWSEMPFLIPSWSKTPRLTANSCGFHLGRRIASLRGDMVVVFTLPYYASLARRFSDVPRVYFAYDPYACYTGWDPAIIAAAEKEMVTHCDAAFAISPALADDFRLLSDRAVFVQPNGVSQEFLAALEDPPPPPCDLPLGGPPIIGCVGQISRAYDSNLLIELVESCPDLRFVFVGPLFGRGLASQPDIERVFAMPNVRWLGPRAHADLPSYINRFDVCLNPLRVDPCNDRRSLLRLYDYMASDRPIVSTAVASAREHAQFVEIGQNAQEMVTLLRKFAHRGPADDLWARRTFIRQQTWERRAETFLSNVQTVMGRRSA